jgi:hypothetical protein
MHLPRCYYFAGVKEDGCFLSTLIILVFDPFDETADF